MEKKEKAPVLRFKDTNGKDYPAWEQRKLCDLGDFNPKSVLPEEFEYVDLESVVGTELLGHRKEILSAAPSRAQRLAAKGDIFFQTVRPYQKHNYLFDRKENNFVFSTGYAQIRPSINPYFLFNLLQIDSFVKRVLDNCTGTSYPAISSGVLSSMFVSISPSTKEREKIGLLFLKLDRTITLHQRKLEALKKLKRTLLQKMFPKKGHLKPELRFFGFTNDWEQRKLEDICDVRDGTHSSPKYFDNGFPLVTSKNLRDGVIDLSDVQLISKEDYLEINKRSKVDLNDILMSMIGTIGNLALIKEEPTFAIKNVALIKSTDKVKMDYLFSYLSSPSSKCDIDKSVEGGTQKFLSLTKVRGLKILLPGIEEQQKIGSFSVLLDGVITLHQRKLEIYKKLKKGLLQKMFI